VQVISKVERKVDISLAIHQERERNSQEGSEEIDRKKDKEVERN
jgi:hypothetical protein